MTAPVYIADKLDTIVHLDKEARRLMQLEVVVDIRLGQVLRALRRPWGTGQVFHQLGFARFSTYTRERLGEHCKTTSRMERLSEAVERFPLLRAAFLERRIDASKVLELLPHLAKHPDEESVQVDLASRLTVRGLREHLGSFEEEDTMMGRGYNFKGREYAEVMEGVNLCRSIHGSDITYSKAWEMIAADLLAGIQVPDVEVRLPAKRCPSTRTQERLEHKWRQWDFLGGDCQPLQFLERPLPTTARALQAEALALLDTRRTWQMALGQILTEIDELDSVCFANIGHYAEERIETSPSQARALVLREKRFRQRPQLREAVRAGRITGCQADILWPALERGVKTEPWVQFASRTTCKVLKRWVEHLLGLCRADFDTWVDRAPAVAKPAKYCPGWVRRLGLPQINLDAACVATLHPMAGVVGMVELFCQTLSLDPVVEDVVPFRVSLEPDAMRVVLLAELAVQQYASEVLSREERALTMVRVFVLTNKDQHQLKGQQKRLMLRDDCTCCAPGCTSRSNLHAHHIVFRSQQGTNEDENEIMLCVPCHLLLVHMGYLTVTGTASALVFEREGEKFFNEMRV